MATTLGGQRAYLVLFITLALLAASLAVAVRPAHAGFLVCDGDNPLTITDYGDHWLVEGTTGNDFIDCHYSEKAVEIRSGKGNDHIAGSNYNDLLNGGQGDDHMAGNGGDDWLLGGLGGDAMAGDDGYDTCLGGRGVDSVFGLGCEALDLGRDQPED